MNNRLKQFLAAENITQAQFADKINVVRASVSHILSGRNKPSFDFIRAMMQQYPNLNMDWFIFGKGKMYKDAGIISDDSLFPEEPHDILSTVEEPEAIYEEVSPKETSTEFTTLDKTGQNTVKQRKVSRIIILFDDGSYQEY